ncbi:MAG: hypothetical protein AUI36_01215 [Cyanobacteria bacterium 13_1_40CM_2_61_4]|nr:MAG: hypothetical protein AUI36_01215 [Cyanobacteria bacterium 13_1_40CM_2_61_4]
MGRPVSEALRIDDLVLRGMWKSAFLISGAALGLSILAGLLVGFIAGVVAYAAVLLGGLFIELKRSSILRQALHRAPSPASELELTSLQNRIRYRQASFLLRVLPPAVAAVCSLLVFAVLMVWGYEVLRIVILVFFLLLLTSFAYLIAWARIVTRGLG